MASPVSNSIESDEAIKRELRSELDAGHISERQHAAATMTVDALANTRNSLANNTQYMAIIPAGVTLYLMRWRRKPPRSWPSTLFTMLATGIAGQAAGLSWVMSKNLRSLGNELYPEERKPLLVLIAACHSRAQLGQEGQDAAFPDSTMFGSNATRVDHEQADGRPANAAVDEFRMAERIEGSAKRAWEALQKVEAHYEAKKRGEQPGPLNLSGPAEGWAPSASQVAHAAVGGRNEGPPAIVPAGDIRARRPQAQSVVPSDGTKERIQGFLQDRKNDSENPEQDRPDKLAQDRKEWEALLEKERQLGQGKRSN